jgi:hypothetical protein
VQILQTRNQFGVTDSMSKIKDTNRRSLKPALVPKPEDAQVAQYKYPPTKIKIIQPPDFIHHDIHPINLALKVYN